MSRNRNHVEHALAQINMPNSIRPFVDREKLARTLDRQRNHVYVGHASKPGVARDVVAVRMGMRNDERNGGSPFQSEPFRDQFGDNLRCIALAGARVLQHRAIFSKQQV